jgi:hypothetical protein
VNGRRKLAALGVAMLVGVSSYSVYATTLDATSSTNFAAGAVDQRDVEGFGYVALTTAPPTFDPDLLVDGDSGSGFTFTTMTVTPERSAKWSSVAGSTVAISGYDGKGKIVTTGTAKAPASGTLTIKLSPGQANAVNTWGVVVQAN